MSFYEDKKRHNSKMQGTMRLVLLVLLGGLVGAVLNAISPETKSCAMVAHMEAYLSQGTVDFGPAWWMCIVSAAGVGFIRGASVAICLSLIYAIRVLVADRWRGMGYARSAI
jgi:hypothetical protein